VVEYVCLRLPQALADEEYGEHTSATGSTVIGCAMPAVPDVDEIAHLLKSVDEKPLPLAQ
jgi:hypothetical protein